MYVDRVLLELSHAKNYNVVRIIAIRNGDTLTTSLMRIYFGAQRSIIRCLVQVFYLLPLTLRTHVVGFVGSSFLLEGYRHCEF